MKSTGKKLILVSFIFAFISSIVIFIYLKPLKTQEAAVKEKTILVAVETIAQRTIIEKKMIKEIVVPDNAIFGDYISDASSILGKYTKESILKDEGFRKDKLLNELEKDLSLKIQGNNRGISINVSGSTGVSDLIKVGDFVDVIVSLQEKKEEEKIINPTLSKMLLQNIEVLAVDKALFRDGEQRVEVPSNYLVTLSVPVTDVEKLILAEDIGELKLVLRPLESKYIHKTEGETFDKFILEEVKEESKAIISNDKNKYVYYTVKLGDTLRKISTNFYGDPGKYGLIKEANKIGEENIIKAGTNIKIPLLEK